MLWLTSTVIQTAIQNEIQTALKESLTPVEVEPVHKAGNIPGPDINQTVICSRYRFITPALNPIQERMPIVH